MKSHPDLIKTNRISFVTMDGRVGLPKYGPYHVIHVGAAIEKIPDEFID